MFEEAQGFWALMTGSWVFPVPGVRGFGAA